MKSREAKAAYLEACKARDAALRQCSYAGNTPEMQEAADAHYRATLAACARCEAEINGGKR